MLATKIFLDLPVKEGLQLTSLQQRVQSSLADIEQPGCDVRPDHKRVGRRSGALVDA